MTGTRLSPQQRAALNIVRLHIALRRKQQYAQTGNPLLKKSLMAFIPAVRPGFERPLHFKPIVGVLDRIEKEQVRVCYMAPPRHGKSETIITAIARYIARNPHKTVAYVTYNQSFATSQAVKIQRLLKRLGVRPGEIQTRKEWRTEQGGGLLCTSFGGDLTGQGVHLLVVDDALKNREDAESPLIRERQWGWWEDVGETRLEPGASVVVLMTRWHEDDLIGRLAERRPEYTLIRIPAVADGLDALGRSPADDPVGRQIGQALFPRRDPDTGAVSYDEAHLARIEREKQNTFSALYQGLPRSQAEKLFPDAVYYRRLPPGLKLTAGIDLAYTKNRRSNYNALVVLGWHWTPGIDPETNKPAMMPWVYVIYAARWKAEIGETRVKLARLQTRFPVAFGAENNGSQKGVNDMLAMGDAAGLNRVRIIPLLPGVDKLLHAQAFSEAWKAGRVLVPMPNPEDVLSHKDEYGTPDRVDLGGSDAAEGYGLPRPEHGLETGWLMDYLSELHEFTGSDGGTDDQVDASLNAFDLMPGAPALPETEAARKALQEASRRSSGFEDDDDDDNGGMVRRL